MCIFTDYALALTYHGNMMNRLPQPALLVSPSFLLDGPYCVTFDMKLGSGLKVMLHFFMYVCNINFCLTQIGETMQLCLPLIPIGESIQCKAIFNVKSLNENSDIGSIQIQSNIII